MEHGKGLPDYLRAYIQHIVVEWIDAEPDRTGLALARKIGVSKAQISSIRGHSRGAGYRTVKGLADLFGVTLDEFEVRAKTWWEERLQHRPPLRAVTDEDVLQNQDMPGWAEAEKRARVRSPLPEWTFVIARRRTGLIPKDGVTPEYVTAEAVLALQYASHDQALRLENEEVDRQISAARKKAEQRQAKMRAVKKKRDAL